MLKFTFIFPQFAFAVVIKGSLQMLLMEAFIGAHIYEASH